jgi:WD40 repeat protein/DNA-binding XRE family transcriptional regulator
VARLESPIDPRTGPLAEFAMELRQLRERAGVTYRALAERAHCSASALCQAANGRRLPTWEITRAFVEGCGEDQQQWQVRWQAVADEIGVTSDPDSATTTSPGRDGDDPRADLLNGDIRPLSSITTPQDFHLALRVLRTRVGNPSLRELSGLARKHGDHILARSTLADVLARTHRLPSWDVVEAFLSACEVQVTEVDSWKSVWGRVAFLLQRDSIPGTIGQGECPYPGLAAFNEDQAQWFYGRDQLTTALIERLGARLRKGGVQVVVAPSGAGKSSLLHAGLLPKLDRDALPGSSQWRKMVLTPTADPLSALANQIATLTDTDPATLAAELAASSQRWAAVLRGHLGAENSRVVVVVDQFEELFTLCADDQQRHTFIESLAQLASPRSGTKTDAHPVGLVVVGVRADFYAACANYTQLRAALQDNPLVVGPMSDTELREAILCPARDVGLGIEPGLVELLLRDLGNTTGELTGYAVGRLPLLAHALRATWQQRRGHTLTVDGYRSTGGIGHAVATTAEGVFTGLGPAGQHLARTLFLRLIKIGDSNEDTRRRVTRTDLLLGLDPGSVGPVVDAFTQGRLLTQEQDTVEITHEALVRAWPRLRQWIDTDRAGNLIRQELDAAADAWDRDRHDAAALYRGSRLDAALTWAASTSHESDLSPAASAFLAESARQEHRVARLRRTVLAVLSVLALVASGAAVVAFQQSTVAQQERDTVTFNQITAQADRLGSTDVSLAAQLSLTAYRMRPTADLYTALVTVGNAALCTPMIGHTDAVRGVALSPDGRTLATGSTDRTVRLWNITDPTNPAPLGQPLTGHTDTVKSVAFSPDGHILVSSGDQNAVRLWNVTDPTHPTPLGPPLTGHTSYVNSAVFSPDGHTLATASADRTVRLWNVTDPTHPTPLGPPLTGHTSFVNSVMFSPDGRTLASADRTVRLWNVTDPTHPTPLGPPLTGHTNGVSSMVFSPDGRTLATGSIDRTVRLWNIPPGVLGGHASAVNLVAFSPDGRTLATASDDSTVRLWNITNPTHTTPLGPPLTGHASAVNSVAFSPDGRILATASDDSTVRLWNITDPTHPTPLGQPLTGHTSWVISVVFNPDGRTLASASDDSTVRLWNVTDPAHPTPLGPPLTGHTNTVNSVAFSPDGRALATGSDDSTVRLWNITDPTHPTPLGQPLTGHTSWVISVAFSPDGRTLATGSDDQTARLWNVTNPTQPTPLGQPLTGHTDYLTEVAFSPDGRVLATGSDDSTVRLWNMNVDQAIQRICTTTTNTLTPAKWEQYVSPDLPYRPPCAGDLPG